MFMIMKELWGGYAPFPPQGNDCINCYKHIKTFWAQTCWLKPLAQAFRLLAQDFELLETITALGKRFQVL